MKQYLLIAATLLALAGCKRQNIENSDSDECVIRFRMDNVLEISSSEITKNDVPIIAPGLTVGSTVCVVAFVRTNVDQAATLGPDSWKATTTYQVDSDGKLKACVVNADGTLAADQTNAKQMELHSGTYDFYAYLPAVQLESDHKTIKGDRFKHNIDFMSAVALKQSISRASSEVEMNFLHQCSKITFNVRPFDGMESESLISDSVVLRKMSKSPMQTDYTLGADLSATLGGDNDTCVIRHFAYLDDTKKGQGQWGAEVTLPKNAGPSDLNFHIRVNNYKYLLKASLPILAFQKGQNYIFTVRVKQGSVDLSLNIVSWDKIAQDNPNMGDDNGSILIGSWSNVDWSGSMGGNPDTSRVPIQVGSWAAVDIPIDFINGQPGGVNSWGGVGQDNTGLGQQTSIKNKNNS